MPQNNPVQYNPVLGFARLLALGLVALGCSTRIPLGEDAPRAEPSVASVPRDLVVTEVASLLTVQSSAGVALSPTPHRPQPDYLAVYPLQNVAATRARLDVELLFRSDTLTDESAPAVVAGRVELGQLWGAQRHQLTESYPDLDANTDQLRWPVLLQPNVRTYLDDYREWSGWTSYGGITVGSTGNAIPAPGASLAADLAELVHPLGLRFQDNTAFITNGTTHTFQTVLLIKSHEGGVGLRVLEDLAPGVTVETHFGPKELGYWELLERAQGEVQAFWAKQLDDDLSRALTEARTTSWLRDYGVRAVALLDDAGAAPVDFDEANAVDHVAILQAEVLPDDEESRVLDVLAQGSVRDVEHALEAFGRFTEAKLEVAAAASEPAVAQLATDLLAQLHEL